MEKKKYSILESNKEFDELVKLVGEMSNPSAKDISPLVMSIFPSRKKNKFQPIFDLNMNDYYCVCSAYDALKMYGKSEMGMDIYNRNKTAFFISKKLNQYLSKAS